MLALYFTFIDEEKDQSRFEEIYFAYRKQMVMVALSVVHSETDAEDVVHEVFLNIAMKHMNTIDNITEDSILRNYLLKATKNTAINWLKKYKHIIYMEPEVELPQVMTDVADHQFIEFICKKMEYENVVNAIKFLEGKYRDAIYYHFVLEIPVPQVADLLGQSISATKKQLVRGKKKLLTLLEKRGGEDDVNQ